MAHLLVVSNSELAAALGRTVVWRSGVARQVVADLDAALALLATSRPALVMLDPPPSRARHWVTEVGRVAAGVAVAVLDRGGLDAAAEAMLLDAGARVVLPVPVDPAAWDARLEELLSVPARRQLRVPVRLETWSRLGAGGEVIEGRALDLSLRGMRLETPLEPPIGSRVDIRFRLPGDPQELAVVGEVVRAAGRGEDGAYLSGIEISVARGDARRRIAAFVEAALRESGGASGREPHAENREWEAALRDDESRKSAILDSALDGVISVDAEGRIVECNPAAARLFGRDRAALYGERAERLAPDDLRDALRDALRAFLTEAERHSGGRRFESRGRRADGTEFPVEISVAPSWVRGRLLATACLRDVTERRRADDALRDSEQRYRLLSERMSETVATLKQAEADLQRSVRHDALTGLANRRFFLETLTRTLSQSKRTRGRLALLFVDLDGFKSINDQLGHQAGDTVLRAVGKRLLSAVRVADAVARMGGDEFTILIHNPSRPDDAARVAEKVLEAIARPLVLPEAEVRVTASIGMSVFPDDGPDAETLLRHADLAMYRAKQEGRHCCRFFTPALSEQARSRLELETDLRLAVTRDQLRLHYQPVVDAESRPVAIEALLRWQHPRHGLLLPERFLAPAADSGLLVPIGDWVLGEACRAVTLLGRGGLRVSVNVSPGECADPGLLDRVRDGLGRAGLDPARLELDLTSAATPGEEAAVTTRLRRLKDMGVSLCLDDSGRRLTSPGWLRSAGFSRLKLDAAFVSGLPRDPDSRAVAAAVLAMARALDLEVVAEGVESRDQLQALRALGCELFQGHLFGSAMPPDPLRRWLAAAN